MPKVANKPARKTTAQRSPSRRPTRRKTRRIARRQAGSMEKLGQRIDQSAGLLAAGAFQLALLVVIAGGLFLFLLSLFSGNLGAIPHKMAAAPESVVRSLGLNVMTVSMKGGEGLSTREVMNALHDQDRGSVIGRPLLLVDAEKLRQQVAALGPVKDVAVQKLLPNTLHLSVTTRYGKALYQNAEGDFFVIDEKGAVIRPAAPTEYTELPVVSGTDQPAEVAGFLGLLRDHPVLFARTAGIEVVGGRRFDLRFRNGFVAKLPEDEVNQALDRLTSLDAGTGSLADNLDYLDLRDPDWAYYQPKSK